MSGKERNRVYYDSRFGEQEQRLNEEELIRWKTIEKRLRRFAFEQRPRIADFGCGRGWLSGKLGAFGEVTGFDLSPAAVANARRSYPQASFETLDASGPIPAEFRGTFDLVVSSEVVEHVEDQQAYLLNAASLLKSGGKLLLTTPNGKWKSAYFTADRLQWAQPVENWLDADGLCVLMWQCGFRVTDIATFQSEWIYDMRPRIGASRIGTPLLRKAQKLTGIYRPIVSLLDRRGFGLNIIVTAQKP